MKKKKINFLLIIVCLMVFIGCIYLNVSTIFKAQERIIEEINNTPIALEVKDETEEVMVDETIITNETIKDTMEVETNSFNSLELSIIILSSLFIVISLLTLIVTKFGTVGFLTSLSTSKSIIYYVMFLIILSVSIPVATIISSDQKILNGDETKKRDEKSVAIVEITKDKKTSSLKEESNVDDTSVIQVSNQANFTADKLELYKNAGLSSDINSSLYYGLNAALITKDGSSSNLTDSKIKTSSEYATAFYVTGMGSQANLTNTILETTKNNSSGLTASDISEIIAENVIIKTNGVSSPAIKTMNEDSTITVMDSNLETNGTNSPLLYSSGKIEATNIKGTAINSYIAILEGRNSIFITESELLTNAIGFKKNNDLSSGVFIYNKDSKNISANIGNAEFTIESSNLSINKESKNYKTAPMFMITNQTAVINITDTSLNFGSNILLNASGNKGYGDKNNNGADVTLTTTDQYLKGEILVDELSKVRLQLNTSTFKGHINEKNLSKEVDVTFDKNSRWILTGDSYVNTLTIQNGRINRLRTYIDSNGYDIYYNANNNEWLNGKTIRLTGGGKLIPVFES